MRVDFETGTKMDSAVNDEEASAITAAPVVNSSAANICGERRRGICRYCGPSSKLVRGKHLRWTTKRHLPLLRPQQQTRPRQMRFWRRKISSNSLLIRAALLMALLHSFSFFQSSGLIIIIIIIFGSVEKGRVYGIIVIIGLPLPFERCTQRRRNQHRNIQYILQFCPRNNPNCLIYCWQYSPLFSVFILPKGAILLCSRSSIFHLQYTPQLTDYISSTALAKRRERTFTKTVSLVSWNSKGRSQPRRVCTPTKNSIKLGRQCDALLILQLAAWRHGHWVVIRVKWRRWRSRRGRGRGRSLGKDKDVALDLEFVIIVLSVATT